MKRIKTAAVFLMALSMLVCAACSKGGNAEDINVGGNWNRPLTFVCIFAAGGDTDYNGRLLAKYLEKEIGQNIICTNVTGGNGAVALTQYKDMKPDNCTFLVACSSTLGGNYASGMMDFSYEAYDPVAIFGCSSGETILVAADSPYKTLEDLVTASQENPGKIIFGSSTGGASYLASYSVLCSKYNAKFGLVDGSGGAERLTALLGGHVDVTNTALMNCKDYIDTGVLRPIATLTSNSPAAYPDIVTACSVYPEMIQDNYYVLLALKGTSPDTIEAMNKAIANVVNGNEQYREEYKKTNLQDAMVMSVAETDEELKKETEHYLKLADIMKEQ